MVHVRNRHGPGRAISVVAALSGAQAACHPGPANLAFTHSAHRER